jgi:signal transduction histidine kinase
MTEILEKKLEEARLQGKNNIHHDPGKQIISSVTHELRTPLAIITSNVELLKKFNYNIDNKVVVETFNLCEEAIRSMTRFVEEVSLLNGFNKGEWKAVCKEFDIEDFFEDILQKLPDYNKDRIRLKGSFAVKMFCTDAYLLSVIIKNLIDNALKFSAGQVFLSVKCSKKELIVQVKDRGIGILLDDVNLVFEPFYRGSNVKMISGSGLGLAIVKRSMDLLKGTIGLTSVIDHGTTFNIKILNNEY